MSAISTVIDTKPKVVRGKKAAAKAKPEPEPEPVAESKPEPVVESPPKEVKTKAPRVKKEVDPNAPPKEKKPTLPAKFAKFMQFGYFFVSSMKDAGLLDDTVSAELFERLCLFASVDDQKAYYETWLSHAKDSNKALRKTVAAQRKASAPPKERKPRTKKDVDPTAPPKTRKPRNKKSNDNDLINELSQLTNNYQNNYQNNYSSSTPTPVTDDQPDKEQGEEQLDVREFVYNEKTYLIDDSTGNVFDTESHDHIGVFDAKKKVLVFV
jgi:hypothetical protein